MTETEPRGEIIEQRPPFEIRSHHLKDLAALISPILETQKILSPEELARIHRYSAEEFGFRLKRQSNGSYNNQEGMEYAKDVLGTWGENGDKYEASNKKFYEDFLSLPDDYPVEIGGELLDAICKGCAIGKHCHEMDNEYYTDKFIDSIKGDKQKTKVKTNIGTVKKVLSEGKFMRYGIKDTQIQLQLPYFFLIPGYLDSKPSDSVLE